MGNCVFKGFNHHSTVLEDMMVKVVTSSGGIMELYAPITVESITNEFPGHGIFRGGRDIFSEPLLHNEDLLAGELYYLLPLNLNPCSNNMFNKQVADVASTPANMTPYRMSTCGGENNNGNKHGGMLKRWSEAAEVVPKYNSSGVWKVKLVISPEQLSEILSQDSRTEALIESVRTVAKCGNGVSSVANSDQWSVSSSWKGSTTSDKFGLDT
ncbi:UvrABC system protein C [Quillaja saponaria]|uniref:UvrABC system protein C n=1 Tax=Quillaja saponaria TaxID=32244 RepID=A0AAD7LSH7_QUISA|nr:UvrABC system protein C [Quillaja saponaria]